MLAPQIKSHHHTGTSEVRAINVKIVIFHLGEHINLGVHSWGTGACVLDRTKLDATKLNKELPALFFAGAIGTTLDENSI